MSVRFSSPLRTFSPEDRFSPGNGPGQGASEFSASECPGEWQMADAGIPDTAKGRRSIFQLREKTGGCSPCLALLAPASQPPGSPPASTRFAYTESAEMPPEPVSLSLWARTSRSLSAPGILPLSLRGYLCLPGSLRVSPHLQLCPCLPRPLCLSTSV